MQRTMSVSTSFLIILVVINGVVVEGNNYVNFMSIQMKEAERLNDLPNIPELADQLGLKTLVKLLREAGMASALAKPGPFTVFGPTDAAFDSIPSWLKKAIENKEMLARVLEYHVLKNLLLAKDIKDEATVSTLNNITVRLNIYPNNKAVTAQCAPIIAVDKMASNGVIHELNAVMVPPSGNIVEAVSGCPVFKTLVTAVKDAKLADALSDQGPFTLFAPTDSAFKKLDPQTLDNLLKNITALTYVLKYHVMSLTYCSAGLVSYKELTTLNGRNITIALESGKVKVNDATVIPGGADGSVTNGVVHAIDTVLIPPGFYIGH